MLRRIRKILTACAFAVLPAGAATAQVESGAEHIFIDLSAPSVARSSSASALLRKAESNGQVRVIVGLRTSTSLENELTPVQPEQQVARMVAEQRSLAQRVGVAAENVVTFEYIPFVSMWVDATQLRRILSDPNVLSVQEDLPGTAGVTVSVPRIQAPTLWNAGISGGGWAVAVLDTGVDKTHPFLAGKVVSEACFSTNGGGASSFCPGGVTQSVGPGTGRNCPVGPVPQCFHGTHVAGIAAGAFTASNPDRFGVARAAKIIAIQVFSRQGNQALTFDSDWIKGLNRVYALRNSFKIGAVNMSLGRGQFSGPCDSSVPAAAQIIKLLRKARIATVVAAMNDSLNFGTRVPACITAAIAVGSTLRSSDQISSFSNHLPLIRHMAPGSDILSSVPNNGWRQESGTSMAAPHVAGAYTLFRQLRPNATVDDISAALECTGVPVTRANITERRVALAQARTYFLNPPRGVQNYPFTNNAPGWLAHAGGWEVVSSQGVLHIREGNAGFKVASVGNCNEGEDITARLIRLGPGPQNLFGVVFKTQFAGARMSGYLAAVSRTGAGVLRRFDDLDLFAGSGNFATLCSGNANVQANGFNILKVVTRGGVHSFSVNGSRVCGATDYSYGTGRAGIFAFLEFTSSQNGFAADSFVIRPVETVPGAGGSMAVLVN